MGRAVSRESRETYTVKAVCYGCDKQWFGSRAPISAAAHTRATEHHVELEQLVRTNWNPDAMHPDVAAAVARAKEPTFP